MVNLFYWVSKPNIKISKCGVALNEERHLEEGLVRLAGGWWLKLIYCERKILLADRWLMTGAELV
jgi:hypothetical protein